MSDYVLFLDVETTINGGDVHGSNPMHPDNKIVLGGHMWLAVSATIGGGCLAPANVVQTKKDTGLAILTQLKAVRDDTSTVTIVGHNLAFDLKYLIKECPDLLPQLKRPNILLWDTLVAEYILNGQDHELSLTLEDTCSRYGIPFVKDATVTDIFKRGEGADKVNPAILARYLAHDVAALPHLFRNQLLKAKDNGQRDLLQVRMAARKALICAEYHGMAVDCDVIIKALPELTLKMADLSDGLKQPILCGDGYTTILDLTKPHQLRTFLYGGTIESIEKQADGLYKNGKIRYKNVKKEHIWAPMVVSGTTSVDEEALEELMVGTSATITEKLKDVLEYRTLQKEVSTYCRAILDHQIDGMIYPNINCTVTATGRLSSSKPNIQNIKNGALKAAFVSRYGDEGRLIEIDFSQLEIIALAVLSNDTQLLQDIMDGVDIHTALFQDMYHRLPTKEERKAFKPRTFALVYGASAKGISVNAKIPMPEAKRFISAFYKRYTGVGSWHDRLKSEWKGKGIPVPGKFPLTKFHHRSPTGLLLTYYTKDSSFSPTQMVNYPVQSFAADLVQVMVGVVMDHLTRNFPTAFLVNVVHDSLVIDAQAYQADDVAKAIVNILRETPRYMRELLNVDMEPIDRMEVGCTIGRNWKDMTEVTYE